MIVFVKRPLDPRAYDAELLALAEELAAHSDAAVLQRARERTTVELECFAIALGAVREHVRRWPRPLEPRHHFTAEQLDRFDSANGRALLERRMFVVRTAVN